MENDEDVEVDDEEDDEDLCNSKPTWSKSFSKARDDDDEQGVMSKFEAVDSSWDAIRVFV
jgi:hypothetical protein